MLFLKTEEFSFFASVLQATMGDGTWYVSRACTMMRIEHVH